MGRVRERGHEEGNKAGRQHERTEAAEKAAVAEGRETEACLREQLAEALRRGQAQNKRADELAASMRSRAPSQSPAVKPKPPVDAEHRKPRQQTADRSRLVSDHAGKDRKAVV